MTTAPLLLLSESEQELRMSKLRKAMERAGTDGLLIHSYVNIYYITGRVFTGYIYIPFRGNPLYFVKRPISLTHTNATAIRKPEQIELPDHPQTLALELDTISYSDAQRLSAVFTYAKIVNGSPYLAEARAVKTPLEIELIAASGVKQERVYRRIPDLYHEGITDIELQIEIERLSRLEGCLGVFRTAGDTMELFMANVLAGENADTPTPYDFAMGGGGLDTSIPVGADGTVIRPGDAVMVDANGNYTGYMTDMTRTFAPRPLKPLAQRAHDCSIAICRQAEEMARPGTEASAIFHMAEEMAQEADLYNYFMGHRQKAGFVGHGLGIEINELPVIAPRSKYILQEGNVIALEPKFVIPDVGAVGIENTYVVTADGLKCLTNAPEQIVIFQ